MFNLFPCLPIECKYFPLQKSRVFSAANTADSRLACCATEHACGPRRPDLQALIEADPDGPGQQRLRQGPRHLPDRPDQRQGLELPRLRQLPQLRLRRQLRRRAGRRPRPRLLLSASRCETEPDVKQVKRHDTGRRVHPADPATGCRQSSRFFHFRAGKDGWNGCIQGGHPGHRACLT